MIIDTLAGQTYYDEVRARFNSNGQYPSLNSPPYDMSCDSMANLWLDPTNSGSPPIDHETLPFFSLNSSLSF